MLVPGGNNETSNLPDIWGIHARTPLSGHLLGLSPVKEISAREVWRTPRGISKRGLLIPLLFLSLIQPQRPIVRLLTYIGTVVP